MQQLVLKEKHREESNIKWISTFNGKKETNTDSKVVVIVYGKL